MDRLIKNRESAQLSRERRRAYIDQLEARIRQLESENGQLKAENTTLRTSLHSEIKTEGDTKVCYSLLNAI